ncbi:MAG: phosphotransferase [bacterium]
MRPTESHVQAFADFAGRHFCVPRDDLELRVTTVQGGLCSEVYRVRVRFRDPEHKPRTASFIAKALAGRDEREAALYESVLASSEVQFAPRLLEVERIPAGGVRLYLEEIRSCQRWPWSDSTTLAMMMERLAQVHESLRPQQYGGALADWDYDAEVAASAAETLDTLRSAARDPAHARFRRFVGPARRLVECLGRMRRALVGSGRATVLHGDAHPGNVIVRLAGRARQAVLLDWARARLGSPLEDVSSWLQSLGFWEDAARRRHDMLLRRYLTARGLQDSIGPSLREAYWLARASNALAGAMRFHLLRMNDRDKPEWTRIQSADSAYDWGRSILRAHACWRG